MVSATADPPEDADQNPAPAAQPEPGATAPDQPAGVTREPEPSDNDELSAADDRTFYRAQQHVAQYFFGTVEAGTVGISASKPSRRSTGLVDAAAASEALRYYCRPHCFDAALGILSRRRVVLLTGAEGIGKRAAALALLREVAPWTGDAVRVAVRISPADTIGELGGRRFAAGERHMVLDWAGGGEDSTVSEFDHDQLVRALTAAGAYLVITSASPWAQRIQTQDLAVRWSVPEPAAILALAGDAGLLSRLSPEDLDRLRDCADDLAAPRDIVALVEGAVDGLDAALSTVDDAERKRARAYFDGELTDRDVLTAAAVAFVGDLPERHVERLLARLESLAAETENDQGVQYVAMPPQHRDTRRLTQTRSAWSGHNGLVCVSRDAATALGGMPGERLVTFSSDRMRSLVVAELTGRYGHQLWRPVEAWLHETVEASFSEVNLRIARGLAALAAQTPAEVERDFIWPWAGGLLSQRLTAAHTLSWMSGDEHLAPTALRIALAYSTGAGPRRAMTAAMAFSGVLGLAYPDEALRWLWFMSLRSTDVAIVARRSLAALLASTIDQPDESRRMLRFVVARLRETLDADTHRRESLALAAAAQLLAAVEPLSGVPLAVTLLRDDDNTSQLARLWAETLRSTRYNGRALDALRHTLEVLAESTDGLAAAGRLGAALRRTVSSTEFSRLERSIAFELEAERGHRTRLSRDLVLALLDAFRTAATPRSLV